ncbi:MAG: dTDP-4-dehydrorhamnose reductase, partial [Neisseriaceae bacterium]|nr:dTDP-4-dehydrorhamnose reductase [Neisseriaceae bacterium]
MRILMTGSRGQIGSQIRKMLPDDWELIATDSKTLDITNANSVENMLAGFQPDILINTAGYTNVDGAENDLEKAFAINAQGVFNLARSANQHGVRMLHLSTDYVFDGTKYTPYTESNYPNPLNIYGKSKLAGEVAALSANPNTLIVRTSGVFSGSNNNFLLHVLSQAKAGEKITVVSDQICCPTYAADLAATLITLARDYPQMRGLYHYTGGTALSWYDFAKKILTVAGLDTALVEKTDSTSQAIARPKYSVLATELDIRLPARPLDEAIAQSL